MPSDRRMLSPRPAPRREDAVVVVAQEALAAAALCWQERAERLAQANTRLKSRVSEVEDAHRKSLTVVKNVPALPNNHVFTKQLVDENHALREETRALQRRLMQFQGPGSKKHRNVSSTTRQPTKYMHQRAAKAAAKAESNQSANEEVKLQHKEQIAANQPQADVSVANSSSVELARHPLVQELKSHLRDLEVDLERLRQENEMLRVELEECQGNTRFQEKTPVQEVQTNAPANGDDQNQLRSCVDTLLQQVKVLEARYQHLEEKARAKAVVYEESTTRLEEVNTQLFETKQQLAAQTEKLHVYSDQSGQMEDLQQEIHLLRSENMKLNETVAALSSRPFEALSKDLQKKNLWIAQLEGEQRLLEEDRAKFQQDCIATRRTNDQFRRRIETLSAGMKDLANKLSSAQTECEQKTMEKEVAQLQLRFYTSPGDYALMSAVGKALKEMKARERVSRAASE
ncbi:hypothetical protein PRNP1_008359 [Phytophthora ramorum]